MRRVKYPIRKNYEQLYLAIFNNEIAQLRIDWAALRAANNAELGYLPQNFDSILTANYKDLVAWYITFKQLNKTRREALNNDLKKIFDYDKWSDKIAEFYKNPQNGFQISSCHYCDMAYINVFDVDPNADALYFLNNADDEELKVLTKSSPRIAYIKAQRPYKSKTDFDRVAAYMRWSSNKWDRTFKPNNHYRHHFDLDHALPKSEFRLVGLSLYNFVPSCQICNQKLKKTRVLGTNGVPKEKLSPTSPIFDFDNKAEFLVIPKSGVKPGKLRPTLHPQDYNLQLDTTDPDYNSFINLFKLQERYQFHKKVALHWLEMRTKYTNARINMMVSSLSHPSFSFKRIKSDIFQVDLYDSGSMSFEKLRRDILK